MKNAPGQVIYVGKAVCLKNRVRSYFQVASRRAPKLAALGREIADFEYIVTGSEAEALIVEDTLIKRYQPRYNVRLKDDKRYPYLKLTAEPFPRLVLTRRLEVDARQGARYFGPYTGAQLIRQAQRMIQQIFRIRTCKLSLVEGRKARRRPCLDHYLGLCDAPCVGRISAEEYRELTAGAALFLNDRQAQLIQSLQRGMEQAARRLEFERAARLRDRLRALRQLLDSQKAVEARPADQDVIGLARAANGALACAQVFFIRRGKLIGRENFLLDTGAAEDEAEVLTAFVKQYYAQASALPPQILLPGEIEDRQAIARWLSERAGRAVGLKLPQRGPKRQLLAVAMRNAELALREQLTERPDPLSELQRCLQLERRPALIEGFDISNIQGSEAVASMVVFQEGRPEKSAYRRFRIKQVQGADDFAMIAEALRRRLEHGLRERSTSVYDERAKFAVFPDLILIDGGKGQLSAARRVMSELGLEKIPTIALAKELEQIFIEHRAAPMVLPRSSLALQLLQRVRDESHRFALAYHRKLRAKRTLRSALDEIPGLGPQRKKLLIRHFGSVRRISRASLAELQSVPGLPRVLCGRLFEALKRSC